MDIIIGLFERIGEANRGVDDLRGLGIPADRLSLVARQESIEHEDEIKDQDVDTIVSDLERPEPTAAEVAERHPRWRPCRRGFGTAGGSRSDCYP